MKSMTTTRLTSEACKPCRIESAPSDGPTVRSSKYLIEAGSAQLQRQVVRFLLPEAPLDHAGIVDPAVDHRSGVYSVFQHDGHLPAHVLLGKRAEAAGSFVGQIKLHFVVAGVLGAALLVGAAEVATGHDRRAIKYIPDLPGRASVTACRPTPH